MKLLNVRPHLVLPELAVAIGLNEAIVLQQLYFIQESGREYPTFEHEGRTWVSMTQEEMLGVFSYLSESTLRRTIRSLEKSGWFEYKSINKSGWDRSKSYTVMVDRIDPVNLTGSHPVNLTGCTIYKRDRETTGEPTTQTNSPDTIEPFEFRPSQRHIIAYSDDWKAEHREMLDPMLQAMGWFKLVEAGEESYIPKAQRLVVLGWNLGIKTPNALKGMVRHFREEGDWRFKGNPTVGNMQQAMGEWSAMETKKPEPEVGLPETEDWMDES